MTERYSVVISGKQIAAFVVAMTLIMPAVYTWGRYSVRLESLEATAGVVPQVVSSQAKMVQQIEDIARRLDSLEKKDIIRRTNEP